MTHGAISELFGVDVVLPDQFFAKRKLIGCRPIQIKNFITRPDEFLRLTMAIETPFHIKRVRFPCEWHFVQLPVTRGATDAVIDMNAMVEKNKIRRLIDTVPFQPLAIRQTFAHRREHRRILPDLGMAGHTSFSRRHSGKRGLFDRCMAKAAIKSESVDMMLVAERHGLFDRHHFVSRPWRPIHGVQDPAARAEKKQNGSNTRSRY